MNLLYKLPYILDKLEVFHYLHPMQNDLSYISVQNQRQGFPKHFHETFCISLIRKGVENIELEDRSVYTEAGSISITNPCELHANPMVDKDAVVNFDTIYISNDLVKYLLKGEAGLFDNRQVRDMQLNNLFAALIRQLRSETLTNDDAILRPFLQQLYHHSRKADTLQYAAFREGQFSEIIGYIEQHLDDKIELEALAKIAMLNKYGFVKKFKAVTGLTPMNYVLMRKVFAAKEQITRTTDLTGLAYNYQFADLPHFSHTFKKYVGVSPNDFKKQQR